MPDLFPHDERIEIIRGDGYRHAFLKRMCKSLSAVYLRLYFTHAPLKSMFIKTLTDDYTVLVPQVMPVFGAFP